MEERCEESTTDRPEAVSDIKVPLSVPTAGMPVVCWHSTVLRSVDSPVTVAGRCGPKPEAPTQRRVLIWLKHITHVWQTQSIRCRMCVGISRFNRNTTWGSF